MNSPEATGTGRNSPLRAALDRYIDATATYVDENHPRVSANSITLACAALVAVTDLAYLEFPEVPAAIPLAFHTVACAGDGVDGAVARKKNKASILGALFDVGGDKFQEFLDCLTMAIQSEREGDNLSFYIHLLSGLSSIFPAYYRERAGSLGDEVKEIGGGTRPVRVTANTVAMASRSKPALARSISGFMLTQNLITANNRRQAIQPGSKYRKGPMSLEATNTSKAKHRLLMVQTAAEIAVTAAVITRHRARRSNSKKY